MGTNSLGGILAGTQIGTMGSTGYATGTHAHMTINGSGKEFGDKFNKILSNKTLVEIDSYSEYMTGYKYNNFYSNENLWNSLYKYSKESNHLNYQDIQGQHYLELEYFNYLHNYSKSILRK